MKCYFIPHTHWDREWYLTFNEYRLCLVRVLDNIIDSLTKGSAKFFMLDGQVSALVDYLEVSPSKEKIVRQLVSENKLAIGPWFTQPDEFLVSGESLIRNLFYGITIARSFGKCMMIGYLPDAFGHTPQLPQILNGFGIDTFLFSRGLADEVKCEFIWQAPDGSRVLASFLKNGYCNALFLGVENPYLRALRVFSDPYNRVTAYYTFYDQEPDFDVDKAVDRLKKIITELSECVKSQSILIMNGCDHLPIQVKIQEKLNEISKRIGINMIIGSLENYFDNLKKIHNELEVYEGELRSAKYRPILADVLSTRVYLKQLNFKAEKLLEKYLEPLATILMLMGEKYPHELIKQLWLKLLLNHAHDSICGTSVDEVHRENVARFQEVISATSALSLQLLHKLASMINVEGERIVIFNPNNWEATGIVSVFIPNDEENITILDDTLTPIVFRLDEVLEHYGRMRKILFIAEKVPPLGFRTYLIRRNTTKYRLSDIKVLDDNTIENSFLKIKVQEKGGTITVVDKVNNVVYKDINIFIDEGDYGDVYNYDKPENDTVIRSTDFKAQISIIDQSPVKATIHARLEMIVPKEIIDKSRSHEKTPLRIDVYYTLYAYTPRLDVKVVINNTAKDHRIRVMFPTKIKTDNVVSEVHFLNYKRPVNIPTHPDWIEQPPRVHPFHDYVMIRDQEKGLLIAARGLYEFSAEKHDEGIILYLTLLRSIGMLSKGDLKSRRGHAGPPIPVPEAQCLGHFEFEYSIIPFGKDVLYAIRRAKEFTHPLIAVYHSGGKGYLPVKASIIRISSRSSFISAFKKCEWSDDVIVRIFNPWNMTDNVTISSSLVSLIEAYETNLLEEKERKIEVKNNSLRITLSPYKIKTLKLKLSLDNQLA